MLKTVYMMAAKQAISAIISKDCSNDDKLKAFFDEFRQFSNINKVRSAVVIGTSIEVCFVDQQSLAAFLCAAPESWNVRSDLKQEKLITISPQFGEGHTQVSDQVMWAAMSTYGKVVKGRRLFFTEFPNIENGVRQFIIEPKKHLIIPSSIRFGKAGFRISYREQVKTCHKCHSSEHIARECPYDYCTKCNRSGHVKEECHRDSKFCSICKEFGHTYELCALLDEVDVILKKGWTKKEVVKKPSAPLSLVQATPEVTTKLTTLNKDFFDGQDKENQSNSDGGNGGSQGGVSISVVNTKPFSWQKNHSAQSQHISNITGTDNDFPPPPWQPNSNSSNTFSDPFDSDSNDIEQQNDELSPAAKRSPSPVTNSDGEEEDEKRIKITSG